MGFFIGRVRDESDAAKGHQKKAGGGGGGAWRAACAAHARVHTREGRPHYPWSTIARVAGRGGGRARAVGGGRRMRARTSARRRDRVLAPLSPIAPPAAPRFRTRASGQRPCTSGVRHLCNPGTHLGEWQVRVGRRGRARRPSEGRRSLWRYKKRVPSPRVRHLSLFTSALSCPAAPTPPPSPPPAGPRHALACLPDPPLVRVIGRSRPSSLGPSPRPPGY